ncbi:MAG: phage major capsid protein, partial [Phycisphaerales bacterium]
GAESRSMGSEQEQSFDRLMADADAIGAQLRQLDRQNQLDAAMKMLETPVTTVIAASRAASKATNGNEEYREAFLNYLRSGDGSEVRALSTSTSSPFAGYTVPEVTEARIVEKMRQASVVRGLAVTRTTPDDRKIPLEGDLPTAAIIGEGSEITASDPTFGQKTIDAFKYAVRVQASRELLDDSAINLESYVIDRAALAIARLQDEHFWDGTDSSQPQGVIQGLTAAGNKQVATGQTTAITSADTVIDWIYKLPVAYRRGAVILTSDEVVKQMRKIKDANNNYIWLASDVNTLLAGGAPGTIMGVPYYISEYVDAVATAKYVAVYGNFSYKEIFDRGPTEILVNPYIRASHWQVEMTVVKRTDAVRLNDDAFMMLQMA